MKLDEISKKDAFLRKLKDPRRDLILSQLAKARKDLKKHGIKIKAKIRSSKRGITTAIYIELPSKKMVLNPADTEWWRIRRNKLNQIEDILSEYFDNFETSAWQESWLSSPRELDPGKLVYHLWVE